MRTDHDRMEAALIAHFHGPGYNAVGHGLPDDCAPCHEAAHVALAALERNCGAQVGPVWKLDGEICGCVLPADHEGWHECSCNAQWCVP